MINTKQPIIIRPAKVARILALVIAMLVLASIAGQAFKFLTGHDDVYGLIPRFYLDYEGNLPTFFSSAILLISAVLLGIIAVFKKREHDSYAIHWTILSVIFLYLSVDEAATIHEMLIRPVKNILCGRGGPLCYEAWTIPFIALLLVFAVLYWKFLFHLPVKSLILFSISAVLYIGGAIGVELFAGWHSNIAGTDNFAYSMIITLEEALEMTGILVFVYALLKYIGSSAQEVCFYIRETD